MTKVKVYEALIDGKWQDLTVMEDQQFGDLRHLQQANEPMRDVIFLSEEERAIPADKL